MAVYSYVYLAEGNKFDFATECPEAIDQEVPEGGLVELRIQFSNRFEGFENYAVVLDNNLRSNMFMGEWMQPWPENYQIVYVDPVEPVWVLRYIKGFNFVPWIVIGLAAIAIAWAAFTWWSVFRAVGGALEKYPWVIPFATVAVGGAVFLNALKRPQEVRTIYKRPTDDYWNKATGVV